MSQAVTPDIVPPDRLKLIGAMLTDAGRVRELNEDSVAYLVPPARTAADAALALVADGMGGHSAGEVASRLAVDAILDVFLAAAGSDIPVAEMLAAALIAANDSILARSRIDPACTGMGTTCTMLAIRDGMAYLGHIGDSRAYLLRRGSLQQISEDQSLVATLLRNGVITAAEAAERPDRNVILQALGTRTEIEPVIWQDGLPLVPGDILLLCSDGLSDCVADHAIAAILATHPPYEACRALIDAANDAGGNDNVSVGVIAVALPEAQAGSVSVTRPIPLTDLEPQKQGARP
jgi:PPM family protein phosphatase